MELTRRSFVAAGAAALAGMGVASTLPGAASEALASEAGTFTVALNSMQSSLQPYAQASDDRIVAIRPIYEVLYAETCDGFEYYLAESVDISEDGTVYTVHLQPEATWSDGEPVTVNDILFTIEYLGLRYNGKTSYNFVNGSPVEFNVIDDKTLEIVLAGAYENYARTLAQFYIMPAHAFGNDTSTVDSSGYFTSADMVTNGAFTVSQVNEDSFVYTARSDYYRGTPQLQTVVMKTIGSGSTKQLAFENGEIDYMRVTNAEDLAKYEADDNYKMLSISEARLNYIQLNPHGPVIDAIGEDGRKAIFLALNAQEIVDFAWGSDQLAVPANSIFTPDQSIYNPDCAGYQQDIETAKALAQSSGLAGQTLTYIFNSARANMEEVAVVVQQQLAAIGVNVQVEAVENASFFSRFFAKPDTEEVSTWDLGTNGWDSQRGTNCGQAVSYLRNALCDCGFSAELSDKTYAAITSSDAAEKQQLWYEIQDQALAEYWEFPLTYTNYVIVTRPNVNGLDASTVIPEFIDYLAISVD